MELGNISYKHYAKEWLVCYIRFRYSFFGKKLVGEFFTSRGLVVERSIFHGMYQSRKREMKHFRQAKNTAGYILI